MKKLYVGNLAWATTDEDLEYVFGIWNCCVGSGYHGA